MLSELNNDFKWTLLKIIVKNVIKNNKEGCIINQRIIELVENNPKRIKEIFKKRNRAKNHFKIAANQFNEVVGEQEIKDSIYKIIECEKEMADAIDFVDQVFEQLLS